MVEIVVICVAVFSQIFTQNPDDKPDNGFCFEVRKEGAPSEGWQCSQDGSPTKWVDIGDDNGTGKYWKKREFRFRVRVKGSDRICIHYTKRQNNSVSDKDAINREYCVENNEESDWIEIGSSKTVNWRKQYLTIRSDENKICMEHERYSNTHGRMPFDGDEYCSKGEYSTKPIGLGEVGWKNQVLKFTYYGK
jgi:hypothetical protein